MARLIMDDLVLSANKFPEKIAASDMSRQITYENLHKEVLAIAWEIVNRNCFKMPIGI